MKHSLKLFFFLSFSIPFLAGCAHAPEGSVTVNAKDPGDRFTFSPEQARHHYLQPFVHWAIEDIKAFPDRETIVFIGSSSIKMWDSLEEDLAPLPVLNRGFGGSTMRDVNTFIDFFTRYESRRIVVYEGDNDLVGQESSIERDFLDSCRKFIRQWRESLPGTVIYFLSIKPSPAREKATGRYREANRRLASICEGDDRLHFIDIFTPMLDEDGNIRPDLYVADGIHMNAEGYALWTRLIRKHLFSPVDQ